MDPSSLHHSAKGYPGMHPSLGALADLSSTVAAFEASRQAKSSSSMAAVTGSAGATATQLHMSPSESNYEQGAGISSDAHELADQDEDDSLDDGGAAAAEGKGSDSHSNNKQSRIWKISKPDWSKLFGYVLMHNMNTKKPKQIYACLHRLQIPIKGTEKAFRGKWSLHRENLEKFALVFTDVRRGDVANWDLDTLKHTPGMRKYVRLYHDPVTALSLGLNILKEKQKRSARRMGHIPPGALSKKNQLDSSSDGSANDARTGLDDVLSDVLLDPSSSKKKAKVPFNVSSTMLAAAPVTFLPGYDPRFVDVGNRRSPKRRDHEDINRQSAAGSSLPGARREVPRLPSPHSKRVRGQTSDVVAAAGLTPNPTTTSAINNGTSTTTSRSREAEYDSNQGNNDQTQMAASARKFEELSAMVNKTNERMSALEQQVTKISAIEKKLDTLIEHMFRSQDRN